MRELCRRSFTDAFRAKSGGIFSRRERASTGEETVLIGR